MIANGERCMRWKQWTAVWWNDITAHSVGNPLSIRSANIRQDQGRREGSLHHWCFYLAEWISACLGTCFGPTSCRRSTYRQPFSRLCFDRHFKNLFRDQIMYIMPDIKHTKVCSKNTLNSEYGIRVIVMREDLPQGHSSCQ